MNVAIVTGASGFVGKAVTLNLLSSGYKVYAVIRKGKENLIPKHENCIVVNCDLSTISDLDKKIPVNEVKYFYHFAWAGSAGQARADASLQLSNVLYTVEAMKVAKLLGCQRFIVAGSIMEHETIAAVYAQGNKPGLGYIYGAAKVAAHSMCKPLAVNLGIDLIWAKITNAYGVGEKSPRMVNTTLRKCIAGESPQFTAGTQNYDFVYIDDVAEAFRLIAEKGLPFKDYLIGSSTARPLKQFLLEMKKSVSPNLDFIFGDIPFTGINLPISQFDFSVTVRDVGFKAKVSFAEGCKKTIEWLKNN